MEPRNKKTKHIEGLEYWFDSDIVHEIDSFLFFLKKAKESGATGIIATVLCDDIIIKINGTKLEEETDEEYLKRVLYKIEMEKLQKKKDKRMAKMLASLKEVKI